MNGLQRAIVEKHTQALDRVHLYSNVGSMGIGGFGGPNITLTSTVPGEEWKLGITEKRHSHSDAKGVMGGYRTRELEWRGTQAEALRGFSGEWVVLEGEQVLAHGSDPVLVVTQARALGIQMPYVFFVEPLGEKIAKMGL